MDPVSQGLMRTLFLRDFRIFMVKNLAEKHLNVSTPAGNFEPMDYLIKSASCPETAGSQGTIMVRISEPPYKNSPEHSWSESRDNYGMRMNQGNLRTNRETPPWPEVADALGPNDNIRKLVQPSPQIQPPIYWHIEILS